MRTGSESNIEDRQWNSLAMKMHLWQSAYDDPYGGALVSTGVWKPDKRAADGPAALKGPVKYKR